MENDCFIMFGIEISVCIGYSGMVAVRIDHRAVVAVRIAAVHIVAAVHMVVAVHTVSVARIVAGRIVADHKAAAVHRAVVLRTAAVRHTVAGYSYNAETAEFV